MSRNIKEVSNSGRNVGDREKSWRSPKVLSSSSSGTKFIQGTESAYHKRIGGQGQGALEYRKKGITIF